MLGDPDEGGSVPALFFVNAVHSNFDTIAYARQANGVSKGGHPLWPPEAILLLGNFKINLLRGKRRVALDLPESGSIS